MARFGLVAATAALILLGGCSLGPDYARPAAGVPEGWKTAPDIGATWPAADWWRGFDSAALDRYIERAQRNNNDIAAAAARVLQADAQSRIAGAPLLPRLDAGGDVSRQRSPSLRAASGGGGGATTSTRYSAALSASYEIDFWGKNRAALDSATALAVASRYDRDTVALTVVANVAVTYLQALEFQDRLAIARDNLANAARVLSVVEARARAGAASDLELAQQRTVVASQRAAIPPLEQQLRQTENALAILLGDTPEQVTLAPESLDAITAPKVSAGLPSELLIRRPDIQNAEAQLVAANADIRAARAAFFPSIQLTAQTGFESLALSALFEPAGFFYSLAAGLTQPIFQGGRLTGQLEVTKARYEELTQNYRKAVISAFADVENALVATRQVAEQQRLQRDAVEQARLAFQLADTRYRAGAVDLLTVLDAQRTLFQARDQLVQIKSAYLRAIVALFRALGGGWAI